MKKIKSTFIIITMIFLTKSLFPLSKNVFKYNVGLKGGINSFTGPATFSYTPEPGITGLVFIETQFSKYSSLEMGVGYHSLNFVVTEGNNSKFQFHNLTLPILYKHYISEYFIPDSSYKLALGLGIETRFLIGKDFDSSEEVDHSQMGLTISLENQYYLLEQFTILIDARLHFGHRISANNSEHLLNRDFMILTGFSYQIY